MNENYQRHQRILNIVSHLGLNKRKKPNAPVRKHTPIRIPQPPPQQSDEEMGLITLARSRLKPIKRKQLGSESQLIEDISRKYQNFCSDEDENATYKHIHKSLEKIEEQQILGYREQYLSSKLRSSDTVYYSPPIRVETPKVWEQNLFQKRCQLPEQQPNGQLLEVKKKLDQILYRTRQSNNEHKMSITNYNMLKTHNILYKQRTSSYFQY